MTTYDFSFNLNNKCKHKYLFYMGKDMQQYVSLDLWYAWYAEIQSLIYTYNHSQSQETTCLDFENWLHKRMIMDSRKVMSVMTMILYKRNWLIPYA